MTSQYDKRTVLLKWKPVTRQTQRQESLQRLGNGRGAVWGKAEDARGAGTQGGHVGNFLFCAKHSGGPSTCLKQESDMLQPGF